jgi:hypothetical protein
MSDATSVDAPSVLFGLEDGFGVRDVQRIDAITVKVVIDQLAREGPPGVWGDHREGQGPPVMRLTDLPACGQSVQL